MMALLFLLITLAMLALIFDRERQSYTAYVITLILSLYWFAHHATDSLKIIL